MRKRLMVSAVALLLLVALPRLRAQTTASNPATAPAKKWNSVPPPKSAYIGKKSGPAPRRDISGTWDAAGMQEALGTSGALEHPALFPGRKGSEGGRTDETGIERPLPYTPLGLEALKANKPSGPGVRQVPAALANDPADHCDPLGFPYMELWEFRTVKLVQTPNQVILLSPFYGNYRIIWTDGRELPEDPDPRWNGYSVGKWVDDYTFVVETTGLNPKSWIDHAGRPHSEDLRVEETFHRVDHDTLELTMKIIDPKMYTEPWLALNKLALHLQPPDFDIPELLCSPSEMADYNQQIGTPATK
jgi:hypothetical protein